MEFKIDNILIVKIALLLYIVSSPLWNHSYISFANHLIVKIALLGVIIGVAFIDIQLAIICMIAFLVMIVNLNKAQLKDLSNKASVLQESMSSAKSFEFPSLTSTFEDSQSTPRIGDTMSSSELLPITPPLSSAHAMPHEMPHEMSHDKQVNEEQHVPNSIPQVMTDFPQPYCGDTKIRPMEISNNINAYFLDEKTKPYEEFIKALSPEESLKLIQSNEIH